MGKDIIGKRVRLRIGGKFPKQDEEAVVAEDITLDVSSEDVDKYDNIIAEKVELVIGDGVDETVKRIMSAMENSDEESRPEILAVCKDILAETDADARARRILTLVEIGAGIASIAQFIIQLRSMFRP